MSVNGLTLGLTKPLCNGLGGGTSRGGSVVPDPVPAPAPASFIVDRFWTADQTTGTSLTDLSGNGGHLVPDSTAAALVSGSVPSGRMARLFTGAESYTDSTYTGNRNELIVIHICRATATSKHHYTMGSGPEVIQQVNGTKSQAVNVGPTANNDGYSPTFQLSSYIYRSCLQSYAHQGYGNGRGSAWVAPSAAAITGFKLGGTTRFQGYWLATVVGRLTGGLYPSGGANWFLDDGSAGSTGANNQLFTILKWAADNYLSPPFTSGLWAVSGNSIACGQGLDYADSFTEQLKLTVTNGTVVSLGVSFQNLTEMAYFDPARVDRMYSASRPLNGVVAAFEPSNSFSSGMSAADAYTAIQAYDATRVAAGITKRVYTTCLARSDLGGAAETERVAYNTTMRAHFATTIPGTSGYGFSAASGWGAASGASRAVLFDADALQVAESLTYQDGIHPTAAAMIRYGAVCGAVCNQA